MGKKDADKENKIIPAGGSFLLYATEDGREKINELNEERVVKENLTTAA